MPMVKVAQNRDGFTAEVAVDGTAVIWCETCEEETPHAPHDSYTLSWMEACGDLRTTHYCEECNERAAGAGGAIY